MQVLCKFYRGNDNLLKIEEVSRVDEDGDTVYDLLGDATVQVTLTDPSGNELSGQSWPLTLQHVAGSQGDFQGVLQDTIVTTNITSGILELTIDWEGLHYEATAVVPFEDLELCPLELTAPEQEEEAESLTIDILGQANAPQRVTGDEGTVVERPMRELIEADRYLAAKAAAAGNAPYGMKIGRIRFGGTVSSD